MYYGWISAKYEDRNILQSLGIILGSYSYSVNIFHDCQVPPKALIALGTYGSRFTWGLDKVSS